MLKSIITFLSLLAVVQSACDNGCSGHGECQLHGVCKCHDNWGVGLSHLSGDCSERICPFELAWVDTPDMLDHFTNMLNVPTEEFAIVTVVNVNASLVTKVKLAREPLALMIALVMVVACTSKTYHMLLYPKIIKRLISSNKVLRLSNTTNGTTPRLAVAIATQVMVMLIAPRDCAIKALMLWMPDLT